MKLSEFKNLVPLEDIKVVRRVGDRFAISKKVQEIQIKDIEENPTGLVSVFFIEVISDSLTESNLQIRQTVIDKEEKNFEGLEPNKLTAETLEKSERGEELLEGLPEDLANEIDKVIASPPPPPENEFLKEGDTESRVKSKEKGGVVNYLSSRVNEKTGEKMSAVVDFLDEFITALRRQLKADAMRWGNTWFNRTKEGQEKRTRARYNDYFDRFEHGSVPVPWLKIVGGALICWIREQHPELFLDNINKFRKKNPWDVKFDAEKEKEEVTVMSLVGGLKLCWGLDSDSERFAKEYGIDFISELKKFVELQKSKADAERQKKEGSGF